MMGDLIYDEMKWGEGSTPGKKSFFRVRAPHMLLCRCGAHGIFR